MHLSLCLFPSKPHPSTFGRLPGYFKNDSCQCQSVKPKLKCPLFDLSSVRAYHWSEHRGKCCPGIGRRERSDRRPDGNARQSVRTCSRGACPDAILVGPAAKQVLMHPHSVAVPPNVNNVAMVKETINQRCGHNLIPKYAPPVLETLVRRQHCRGALVACVSMSCYTT